MPNKTSAVSRSDSGDLPSSGSSGAPTIMVGPELPLQADIFITSIDEFGNPGPLNRVVLSRLGYELQDLPKQQALQRGYALLERAGRQPVLFVVTITNRMSVEEALQINLGAALRSLPSIAIRPTATLWLPLMGTGTGKLAPELSFKITLDLLRRYMPEWSSAVRHISISCDKRTPHQHVGQFIELAQQIFADTEINISAVQRDSAVPPPKQGSEPHPTPSRVKPNRRFQDDTRTLTDTAADRPGLGFDKIAQRIIELVESITSHKTGAPDLPSDERMAAFAAAADARLTLGIFAPWGAGKSTLLNELRRQFKERRYLTIVVNPWKWNGKDDLHDYVREAVISQAQDQGARLLPWLLRMRTWWRTNSRLLWFIGLVVAGVVVLGPPAWRLLPVLAAQNQGEAWNEYLGQFTSLQSLITLGVLIAPPLWNLLAGRLGKLLEQRFFGSVQSKLGADGLSQAYRDIAFLILRRKNTFTPFIFFFDDLDRCGPERVALVLESVHSLTAAGCVVFIACDDEYVVASINAQYERVAKHFPSGTNFGRRFLEKIVQIPFRLPLVKNTDIFEIGLAAREPPVGRPDASPDTAGAARGALAGAALGPEPAGAAPSVGPIPQRMEAPVAEVRLRHIIGDLLGEAVEPLGMNLRQVKSVSNVLKLYLAIAGCTTEADARRLAAFIFADRMDPRWLDARYHGVSVPGTLIGSVEKLAARLEEMIGEDRTLLLRLYHLLGRQPMPGEQLRPTAPPAAPPPA